MEKKYRFITAALFLFVFCLAFSGASVARADSDGDWRYIMEDNGCVVINYYGNETNVVVPESFRDVSVKSIGTGAFYNKELETITLPPSVTLIDNNAFQDCHSLREVRPYPGKSLNIRTIGWYAFYKTALSDLSGILRNVTYMDDNVFYGCENLTSVTLLDCLQGMGACDFKMCTNLKKVSLPKNSQFTKLPAHTFYGCTSLKSVAIPGNVTTIGDKCFYKSGITSFTIPQSVTSVGVECFALCDSLKKLIFMGRDCAVKRDLLAVSPQAKVYGFKGGSVEKYAHNYRYSFVPLHTVTFKAGGGYGKMAKETVAEDEPYTLPKCGFTAPAGKAFDKWDKGAPGTKINVTADTVITALWKTGPLKKVKISRLSVFSTENLKVKWDELSKADRKAIKYIEIEVSTDKHFKKIVKHNKVKSSKTTYYAMGLKKNTKYWVRIRAYTKKNGNVYVSAWSTKSIKTKKK